jgi:replicative DNA helicase
MGKMAFLRMAKQIFSHQVEKHVLSGLLKHPKIFADIDPFLSEKDFYQDVHSTIYSIVKESLLSGEKIDKVLVANKIKNLGIAFKDEVNIFDYVEDLFYTQITDDTAMEACRDLSKLRMSREIHQMFGEGQKYIENNLNDSVDEIIANSDKIYGDKISSFSFGQEPVNVFDGLEEMVEERGNNPLEESGLQTPYPEFNRMFGGLLPGNIYSIISRPGEGKTTWLQDMCFKTSIENNTLALFLDTEMSTEEFQFRMLASLSGVPLWYIQTGNWRKDPDMCEKIRKAWAEMKNHKYYHYPVGNMSIDEVCSVIRRWYYSKVGRGNTCIVAYDYIKMTGENVGKNWAEYQAIGEKIDKLKKISEEISAPIITAMQQNRSGEHFNKRVSNITDDSSTAAQSDRLQWFASFVGIFRRKVPEEMALDTEEFGTHKLIALKTRFQGRDAAGHQDIMRRTIVENIGGREVRSTKWTPNFINYDVNNFAVNEKGSLRHVIEREQERPDISDENNPTTDDFL